MGLIAAAPDAATTSCTAGCELGAASCAADCAASYAASCEIRFTAGCTAYSRALFVFSMWVRMVAICPNREKTAFLSFPQCIYGNAEALRQMSNELESVSQWQTCLALGRCSRLLHSLRSAQFWYSYNAGCVAS